MTASCRRLLTELLLGKRRRGEVAKPRMPLLVVVENLDVLGDLADGLGAGVVVSVVGPIRGSFYFMVGMMASSSGGPARATYGVDLG